MDRARWLLIGVLLTVVPLAIASGVDISRGGLLVLVAIGIPLVLVAAVGGRLRGRRAAPRWTTTGPFRFEPAAPRRTPSTVRVAGALGRVEARELLPGSLAFGAGIGFCALMVLTFGIVWSGDRGGEVAELAELFPAMVHPLAGMTLIAAHRARTRGRRDGTEELFGSCPATAQARTAGHLVTAWVPAVTAAAFAVVLFGADRVWGGIAWGGVGPRQVVHVTASLLLPVGALAIGILLARVAPWPPVPILAVVGIGLASVQLATSGDRSTDASRNLSSWLTDPEVPVRFTDTRWLTHHLWILGLVSIAVLLALLADSRDRRRVIAVLVGASVLTAGAGFASTRPIQPADAQRIAALVRDRDEHQTCLDAGIPVCTYRGDEELGRRFARHVSAVTAAAPSRSRLDIALRQGSEIELAELDPAVAALVPEDFAAGALPVQLTDNALAYEGARLWVALALVGAVDGTRDGAAVDLGGQARGVAAIWLATRGLEPDRQADLSSPGRPDDPADDLRPWPDECYAGPTPVRWALSDLEAARQLLGAPAAAVAGQLRRHWAAVVDPSTTTDELLGLLDLAPVGPPTARTPASTGC